jgi:phosphoribosyl 1,2-cyclic phosphate phosphodiesterase
VSAPPVSLTVLGSGTSMGVPTIGCPCAVCHSNDPRNKRTRPSVLLQYDGRAVVIDTTPDFRSQALRADLRRLDAVLLTHAHADHILGLDDVRPFNIFQRAPIPVYANRGTLQTVRRTFAYIFTSEATLSTVPQIELHELDGAIEVFGLAILPVPVLHGPMEILGFRFGRCAYLTDFSVIPEASLPLLADLDILFLDALRHVPHPTHCTVDQALAYVDRLKPRRALLTHICHDLEHEATNAALPAHVRLAYDGLELEVAR